MPPADGEDNGHWLIVVDNDRAFAAAMVDAAGLELTEAEFEDLVDHMKTP